ncbi:glycerophosphoinositol inositolphosphodiesterase GDPD2 isoform X2 [Amia ocellicauda]
MGMNQNSLCRKCLRGVYSCHWKHQKLSMHRCACCWFSVLAFVFLLTGGWIYVCWAAFNDRDEVNWEAFRYLKRWVNWFMVVVILSSVMVSYCFLLLVFALLQVALREALDLHCIHKVLLFAASLITTALVVGICIKWKEEWDTVVISLRMAAPFLQLGGVVAVSLLGWFVFQRLFMASRRVSRVLIFMAYVVVVAGVFLSPLLISSPCIVEAHRLPPKPALLGHRGAPVLAPENTMLSFKKSLECGVTAFETDVMLSQDEKPFLMHDKSLLRTTNVMERFPERKSQMGDNYTLEELKMLNAGDWFLKSDPFHTVSMLSEEDRKAIRNQTIPSLEELLTLAKEYNTSLIFDLKTDSTNAVYTDHVVQTILNSSILQNLVLWLPPQNRDLVMRKAPGFRQVYANRSEMEADGGNQLNLKYSSLTTQEIGELRQRNVSLNLYVVNEPWLFSLLWCSGVTSVTTNACHIFKNMTQPVWVLAPDTYRVIWITVDVAFLLSILGLFFLQRWRFNRGRESEEHRNGYSTWVTQQMNTIL